MNDYCSAHGCPMPGTITHGKGGENASWYCRYHIDANFRNYQAITHGVRLNLPNIEKLQRIECPHRFGINPSEMLTNQDHEVWNQRGLPPRLDGESPQTYRSRIGGEIEDAIKHERRAFVSDVSIGVAP